MIAEDRLQRIIRIFIIIGFKDDVIRINVASFQFTKEAIHWWDITLISNPIAMMKWTEFERLFLGQNFTEEIHKEKMSDFSALKQRESTMMEYEMKFTSLAHFVTTQLVDDIFKATRLNTGL